MVTIQTCGFGASLESFYKSGLSKPLIKQCLSKNVFGFGTLKSLNKDICYLKRINVK